MRQIKYFLSLLLCAAFLFYPIVSSAISTNVWQSAFYLEYENLSRDEQTTIPEQLHFDIVQGTPTYHYCILDGISVLAYTDENGQLMQLNLLCFFSQEEQATQIAALENVLCCALNGLGLDSIEQQDEVTRKVRLACTQLPHIFEQNIDGSAYITLPTAIISLDVIIKDQIAQATILPQGRAAPSTNESQIVSNPSYSPRPTTTPRPSATVAPTAIPTPVPTLPEGAALPSPIISLPVDTFDMTPPDVTVLTQHPDEYMAAFIQQAVSETQIGRKYFADSVISTRDALGFFTRVYGLAEDAPAQPDEPFRAALDYITKYGITVKSYLKGLMYSYLLQDSSKRPYLICATANFSALSGEPLNTAIHSFINLAQISICVGDQEQPLETVYQSYATLLEDLQLALSQKQCYGGQVENGQLIVRAIAQTDGQALVLLYLQGKK